MSRPPLPAPIAWTSSRDRGKTWITTESDPTDLMPDEGGIVHSLHTDNQCRAYVDAVSAADNAALRELVVVISRANDELNAELLKEAHATDELREQAKVLEDHLRACTTEEGPSQEELNRARTALEDK